LGCNDTIVTIRYTVYIGLNMNSQSDIIAIIEDYDKRLMVNGKWTAFI